MDRQIRLLDYLTSSGTIFGEEGDVTLDPVLRGIDPRLLRLEASFSHEKRMEKIIAVFPKTYRLLGAERAAIVRAFVNVYPRPIFRASRTGVSSTIFSVPAGSASLRSRHIWKM